MATFPMNLTDIIAEIRSRLYKLERATFIIGSAENTDSSNLALTSFVGAVSYYKNQYGAQYVEASFTWNAINNNDPDNLDSDPVVDYMFSVTRSTDTSTGLFYSTNNKSSAKVSNLPVGVPVTGRAYAITAKGVKGPVASYTVTVGQDTTPPPQPSTPTVTPRTSGVSVAWDGKTATGVAMPSDVTFCQVLTSTEPTGVYSQVGTVLAGSSMFISSSSTTPIYVRLVAVDKSGNVGVVQSAYGNATPATIMAKDLDIVLPGEMGFTETNNYVIDGSFEDASIRSLRLGVSKIGNWNLVSDANTYHGSYLLTAAGDTTATKNYFFNDNNVSQLNEFIAYPGEKLYARIKVKGVSSNGVVGLYVRARKKDNTTVNIEVGTKSTAPTVAWETIEGACILPQDTVSAAVFVQLINATTGTWYFDAVQCYPVVTSSVIEDGAITRAKIGDAAIGTLQVEEIDAGRIKSGYIAPERIDAGTITAAMISVGAVGSSQLAPAIGDSINISNNPSVVDKATVADLNRVENTVNTVSSDVDNIKNTIVIGPDGINISKQGSPFQISMDNDSLDLIDSGIVTAYINSQKMYIKTAEIKEQLIVGVHTIEKYGATNTFIRWTG